MQRNMQHEGRVEGRACTCHAPAPQRAAHATCNACDAQAASGWGVAHHAAFFAAGLGVFRRLADLGVCLELRTADGLSVLDIAKK